MRVRVCSLLGIGSAPPWRPGAGLTESQLGSMAPESWLWLSHLALALALAFALAVAAEIWRWRWLWL